MKKKIAIGLAALAALMGGGVQAAQAVDFGEYYFFSTESACLGAMDRMQRSGFVITAYCAYRPQQGSSLAWSFAAR
ncbi:hypothetical protein [Microbacterium sp. 13-71-7]|jgi:hypothetical protein|uniref:hypothetical protein n=1 Tax=Microbacterium sp. 13-71-7 TaxID=1970399 RepID=UPI000BDD687E|nr:hypothetical protein [Microbacterium sp. 13-71-7]OZB85376.1 MAG: hypothetical protein B7X32_03530 [Microbacterium sp. 13-71-7]